MLCCWELIRLLQNFPIKALYTGSFQEVFLKLYNKVIVFHQFLRFLCCYYPYLGAPYLLFSFTVYLVRMISEIHTQQFPPVISSHLPANISIPLIKI